MKRSLLCFLTVISFTSCSSEQPPNPRLVVGTTTDNSTVFVDETTIRKMDNGISLVTSYIVSQGNNGGQNTVEQLLKFDCNNRTYEALSERWHLSGGETFTPGARERKSPYVTPNSPAEWVMNRACR